MLQDDPSMHVAISAALYICAVALTVCDLIGSYCSTKRGRLVWRALPDSLARGEESAESSIMRHTFANEVPHQYVAFTHGLAR